MNPRFLVILATISGHLVVVGCSRPPDARAPEEAAANDHGGRLEPTTAIERELLTKVESLPVGPSSLGGQTVTAGPGYDSASGQRCRRVSWSAGARLACRDANGWYFVPDVFGTAGGS